MKGSKGSRGRAPWAVSHGVLSLCRTIPILEGTAIRFIQVGGFLHPSKGRAKHGPWGPEVTQKQERVRARQFCK